jgi:hypothetical protein
MAKSYRIETTDNEGNAKVVIVRKPSYNQLTEAQLYSAYVFNKARAAGACLRSKLNDYLNNEGVWTKDNQSRAEAISDEISEKIKLLETGKTADGNKLKLSEGRELAIKLRRLRLEYAALLSKLHEYDAYTVEGQAENAKFDHLVSSCVFDEEGNRVFESVEDYYDKQSEQYAAEAAAKLAIISGNVDPDWEKQLPENKFLLKYKFIDNNLYYVDRQGRHVTVDGKLVDDDGFYINEDGKKVDREGNLVQDKVEAEFENDVD